NEALPGQQANFKLHSWYFTPLISPSGDNPIVRNLNFIELNYASTIDTVGARGIKKTVLLSTSKETKLLNSPVRIALAAARITPDEKQFNQFYEPVAVLLEGKFESVYKDRMTAQIDTSKSIDFKPEGVQNSMIVVSDGDVIANDVKASTEYAYPLGYDKYANAQFGNKDFIVNCMNYLCGDSTLLSIRTKQLQLRLLDTKKAHLFKTQWQIINLAIPIGLIILLGMALAWVRKEKFAK
ncbi:MAG TPA: gliding motility-associated ABC transporter substrate-binding protein GldG, partial [Bacteroidia bacterium]|nr:gliding motility-associated ABC transporter substrate-binding protein GldG [Bacteroidia bacterium]